MKAVRSLEIDADSLEPPAQWDDARLEEAVQVATHQRLFAVAEALRRGLDPEGRPTLASPWTVGRVHALSDECTHRSCSLSEGELDPEGHVVCRTCGSRFDLDSGEPTGGPAVEPVSVYLARVEDGWVEVSVTSWAHNGTEG